MALATASILQAGLPEFVPDLIGFASTLVLVLMLAAIAGFVYRMLTGGVDWPEDEPEPEEDDGLRKGGSDDEWDYY